MFLLRYSNHSMIHLEFGPVLVGIGYLHFIGDYLLEVLGSYWTVDLLVFDELLKMNLFINKI